MRSTTVHNGTDKSPRQSPRQRRVELFNGVSCHGKNGYHGEKLDIEQCNLSRTCASVKLFDNSHVSRGKRGDLGIRGCCKVVAQTDTVHIIGSNGNNVHVADAIHRTTNINGVRTNSNASELPNIRNAEEWLCTRIIS